MYLEIKDRCIAILKWLVWQSEAKATAKAIHTKHTHHLLTEKLSDICVIAL